MSKRERVHASHSDLKRSIYQAAPGAGDRVDMTVSGNPDVFEEAKEPTASASYRKGGRVTSHGYFSDHHAYKLRGHR